MMLEHVINLRDAIINIITLFCQIMFCAMLKGDENCRFNVGWGG